MVVILVLVEFGQQKVFDRSKNGRPTSYVATTKEKFNLSEW